jgi:crossover junction endodeoxyribonuclease RusA
MLGIAIVVVENNVHKIEGRLSLFLSLYPPDKRKRDIGNYEKQTTDALMNAGLFDDDEQIDLITIVRQEIVKGGKCIVVIAEIENEQT